MDEGESIMEGVIREVREETGIEVSLKDDGEMMVTVEPFALWESCYPTSGKECMEAGTGIRAHYLVVFCIIDLPESDDNGEVRVVLQEEETDMAIWLSRQDFQKMRDFPNGGTELGKINVAASTSSTQHIELEELCGIYPRENNEKFGIEQGNLLALEKVFLGDRFCEL